MFTLSCDLWRFNKRNNLKDTSDRFKSVHILMFLFEFKSRFIPRAYKKQQQQQQKFNF